MPDKPADPKRPQRIAGQANELADYLQEKQQHHARLAQDFGYASDSMRSLGEYYGKVPDSPLLARTEQSFEKYKTFVQQREAEIESGTYDLPSIAYMMSVVSTGTATVTAASTLSVELFDIPPALLPPQWPKDRVEQYARKLTHLDPELGRLARGVWQSFHGGTDTAARESLALARQLFDHFFGLVAPDDRVQASTFFSKKPGQKPNQVHREERLRYAASLVADRARRELLDSQVSEVLGTYEQLNRLHTRGPLERTAVGETVRAMWAILEQWLDSIGIVGA